MKPWHKIVIGDSRKITETPDESVHLAITSPPYWQLKDYGNGLQIGFHDSYEQYINNLNLVWKECHRVLHQGCRLCINIGDQFARSAYYGRYKVIPIRTEITKFCETIGFDYMGAIIWQKVTTCNTTGGTTSLAARNLERNSIGYEINDDFLPVIKGKLNLHQTNISLDAHYEIGGQAESKINAEEEIKKLPYVFHDPIRFDKKIDPRKMNLPAASCEESSD